MEVEHAMTLVSEEVADGPVLHAGRPDQPAGPAGRTVDAMDAELDAMRLAMLGEVRALADTISAARDEIAKLRSEHERGAGPIPEATDELDAIVQHTADATETILGACEALDALAPSLSDGAVDLVGAQTMRIYEACSFQDITGQRISKVVAALKLIETRILRIAGSYEAGAAPAEPVVRDPLLNGPQSQAHAMDQDAIDRLLTF